MDDFLFLFATRELAQMGAVFIDATLTALRLKRSIKKSVSKLGTYAAPPALGAVGGFSVRPLLGAAGSGEVDPSAGGAAPHPRDGNHGERGGEEIGSFRRQGSISGLGMSPGKVQDAGNSQRVRGG
jgi:hypothetical protein